VSISADQRDAMEARKRAAQKAMDSMRGRVSLFIEAAKARARRLASDPAWLDLCMVSGIYEDHLAESHGDAEDVFC